jgi:hypothetical protein
MTFARAPGSLSAIRLLFFYSSSETSGLAGDTRREPHKWPLAGFGLLGPGKVGDGIGVGLLD